MSLSADKHGPLFSCATKQLARTGDAQDNTRDSGGFRHVAVIAVGKCYYGLHRWTCQSIYPRILHLWRIYIYTVDQCFDSTFTCAAPMRRARLEEHDTLILIGDGGSANIQHVRLASR